MRQVLQNLRDGKTLITEVPTPALSRNHLLIRTYRTLISAGTERMLVEFSKGGFAAKARSQPDKVKQVIDKIKTDGLVPTVETVFKRLDEPLPLGYCNVGVVQKSDIRGQKSDIVEGDRVVCNGPHAEMVCVPYHLCAKIPDNVSDEEATFTVLGAIGLQGIRLSNPTLGEKFVVYGAGLIGLMVVQLLRASGCHVLAIDLNDQRLGLAESYGAKVCNAGSGDPISMAKAWTGGTGVDGVIITASTKSDLIIHQAAEMCRKRARIILVGVVGLNLQRADFYEKEITFQVSCSYGPGRYDDSYEKKGQDYPISFVRWTEQRNFQAVLSAMAGGQLDVASLITDRFSLDEAENAYGKINRDSSTLGIILEYPGTVETNHTISFSQNRMQPFDKCVAAMIGSGNFAKMTMGPALAKTNAQLKWVSARTNGAAASHLANKYGFENATTDLEKIWDDPEANTVFIATQHNSHAALVLRALKAGKHIFVEKPLCLTVDELVEIKNCYEKRTKEQYLMVGFNRRFAPLTTKMKELLAGRSQPLSLVYTVNAGFISSDHWSQDPEVGGGRIIGEACHFIDLFRFLVGHKIENVEARMMGNVHGIAVREDKMTILLTFLDGSIGTVHYLANGSKRFPKERLEVFSEGRILVLDNFKRLKGYGWKGFRKMKLFRQDKGHRAEVAEFIHRISEGGEALIPWPELEEVTRATFAAVENARKY